MRADILAEHSFRLNNSSLLLYLFPEAFYVLSRVRRCGVRYVLTPRLAPGIEIEQNRASMADSSGEGSYLQLTANIVAAYVSKNTVPSADIPALISQVYSALMRVAGGQAPASAEPHKPAVPVKRSVTAEYIVCLEDGKKFKSLKRHLRTQYDMTPEKYREKWGLPPDYPMVAPNYAAARSQLAKKMGLGQQRGARR